MRSTRAVRAASSRSGRLRRRGGARDGRRARRRRRRRRRWLRGARSATCRSGRVAHQANAVRPSRSSVQSPLETAHDVAYERLVLPCYASAGVLSALTKSRTRVEMPQRGVERPAGFRGAIGQRLSGQWGLDVPCWESASDPGICEHELTDRVRLALVWVVASARAVVLPSTEAPASEVKLRTNVCRLVHGEKDHSANVARVRTEVVHFFFLPVNSA